MSLLRNTRLGVALVGVGVVALVSAYLPVSGQAATIAAFNKQVSAQYAAGVDSDGDHDGTAAHEDESQPGCGGCQPPLLYTGGSVLGTDAQAGEVTLTPIYWAPTGYSYSSTYKKVINQYVNDVAADSGKTSNVYAVNTEYSDMVNGATRQIKYVMHANTTLPTDTAAYPQGACTPAPGYKICLSQDQVQAELTKVLTANNQPSDLGHLYLLLLPQGVQTTELGLPSGSGFCGIHFFYQQPGSQNTTEYVDDPYLPATGCGVYQAPNGDKFADGEIGTLSHEINEAITDPGPTLQNGNYAWNDPGYNEVGDMCNQDYGPPLGSASTTAPTTTLYNQVINGHRYYTQRTFSNQAFAANQQNGCLATAYNPSSPRLQTAHDATGAVDPTLETSTVNPEPNQIPADGTSTSTVTTTVLDGDGQPVSGDHVSFDVHATPAVDETPSAGGNATGDVTPGACGTLDTDNGVTDDQGNASVTYTASTDNVDCTVYALDAEGGFTNAGVIYQGTASRFAPTITQTSPVSVVPGGPAVTFSTTGANSSPSPLSNIEFNFLMAGDSTDTTGIDASQVHLEFEDETTNGFQPFPLDGTTVGGGTLSGTLAPDPSGTLANGESHTITFRMSLDASVPMTSDTKSPLVIENDFNEVNGANGAINNLDYAGPDEVVVAATPVDLGTAPVVTTTTPAAAATTAAAAPAATTAAGTAPATAGAPATPGTALPFTGSTASPALVTAGILAMLFGAGFIMFGTGVASQSRRNDMLVRLFADRPRRG